MPNWKKVIVSGSDAALSSLNVDGALTASGLIYPTSDGTSEQVLTTDGLGNLSFADLPSEDVTTTVKNLSGTPLAKGTPVHAVSGSSSGNVTPVIAASASDATTMPATFILGEALTEEAEGTGIAVGSITGIDTSTFTVGDIVYVGENGGYTNVKPTSSGNLIQNLGVVTKVHASNGAGFIYGSGRSNDVPNLPTGKIWVGTSNYTVTSSFVHLDESNGRLGIGTTTPDYPFEVESPEIYIAHFKTTANVNQVVGLEAPSGKNTNLYFYEGSTPKAGIRWDGTNDKFIFKVGNTATDALTIADNGNVGIGTTSPSAELTVQGSIHLSSSLPQLRFSDLQQEDWQISNDNGDFRFTQLDDNVTAMYISSSGNVGIGDTSPTRELTVNGDIGVKNSGKLYLWDSHNNNYIQYDKWTTSASSGMTITNQASTGNLSLQTVSSTRLFISASGNVGIGTTSPTEKLEVAGNIKLSTTGDYLDISGLGYLGRNAGGNVENYEMEFHFADANNRPLHFTNYDGVKIFSIEEGVQTAHNNFDVTGNLTVGGIVTAQEFHTDFVSASIIYESGSTKFGDSSDDVHEFTGSSYVHSGSYRIDTYEEGIGWFNGTNYTSNRIKFTSAKNLQILSQGATQFNPGSSVQILGGKQLYFNNSNNTDSIRIHNSGTGAGSARLDFEDSSNSIKMSISSSGNVGIGTSTPGYKLQVAGNTKIDDDVYFFNTVLNPASNFANQRGAGFDASSGKFEIAASEIPLEISRFSTTGPVLSVRHSGSQVATIDTDGGAWFSGDVGIGTNSPGVRLDVNGATAENTEVRIKTAGNASEQPRLTLYRNSVAYGEVKYNPDGGSSQGVHITDYRKDASNIIFNTSGSVERMRVTVDGNVGIGTTSPATKLDVSGSIRMSAPGPVLTANSTNQQSGLRLNVTNLTSGADLIRFQNNGTTLLKVKENGNVGIGNNLTATEKLHISGGNVLIETDSGAELNLKNTSSGVQWQVVSGYNGGFEIGDVTNSRQDANAPFFISNGAQVGIGTTSPSSNLHISASSTSNTPAVLVTNDAGNEIKIGVVRSLAGTAPNTSLFEYDSSLRFVAGVGTTNEVVRFASNGTVGIGTSAPTQKLEVRDGNLVVSSSNSEVVIGTSSGKPRMQSNGNQDLLFSTANQTNVLYLQDANGRVGIGTTSPTKKLTVAGAISASSGFYGDGSNLTGITTSDGLADILENSNSAGGFSIDMNNNDITNVGEVQATIFNGPSASLSYVTASAGLFIDAPVTLRDGSTSDLALNFSSSANTGFYISEYGAGSGKQFNIRVNGSNIGSFNAAGVTSNANVYTGTSGQFRNYAGVWKATTGTAGGDAQFILNGKTIMHLDETDEYVGIGTTVPTQKLTVAGNISASGAVYSDTFAGTTYSGNSFLRFNDDQTLQTNMTTLASIARINFMADTNNNDGASARMFTWYANTGDVDTATELMYLNKDGALNLDGDLTVGGIVTAQEFHTEFVSASIVYSSGSTKFGDTQDDRHSFTGNILTTGSAIITENLTVGNSSSNIHSFTGNSFTVQGNTPYLYLKDLNNSYGGGATMGIYFDTTGGSQGFIGVPSTTYNDIYITNDPAQGTVGGETSGHAHILLIPHNNVGVGTEAPSEKLHVSGTVAITDTATVRQTARVQTGDPSGVTLEAFDATTYFGAFLDYVVYDVDKNNMRSGTIQIVFDENGNVQHTDNSTADVGDTTGAYFDTTSSGTSARLWYYADSTEWFVRYHLRYL